VPSPQAQDGRDKLRVFRCPDDIWADALATAAARNEAVSEVIRKALRGYVKRHRHLLNEQPHGPVKRQES